MLTLTQNILILVGTMTASLLYMVAINRAWPAKVRYAQEDMIGWQLSILATTYAVVMGFMLYTEWTNFVAVNLNVEVEAGELQNVYQLAEGLPARERALLQAQAHAYATSAVTADWPDMAAGRIPVRSNELNQAMWKTLLSVRTTTASESTAQQLALTHFTTLSQSRRIRVLQSVSRLPTILWCVLVVGAALTMVSVGTFGSRVYWLHAFQVFSLTLLITLAMLAIADLNCPFQGWVHVGNYAFQRAEDNMHETQQTSRADPGRPLSRG
ncbi:MAG TPA: DUF4239 domain-containing protein [Steroidobacteraceae bacterium]|nr:DUF4239 domain-containing protein [Steroidobacteraceae bacterium]